MYYVIINTAELEFVFNQESILNVIRRGKVITIDQIESDIIRLEFNDVTEAINVSKDIQNQIKNNAEKYNEALLCSQ